MKQFLWIVACLVMVGAMAYSQSATLINGKVVKTFTTYLSTSDDTTGFITAVGPGNVLLDAEEVVIVAVATDSVHADVYFIGNNSKLTNSAGTALSNISVWADSLAGWADVAYSATAPYTKVFAVKGKGVNKLPGCNQFKIGTVFKNAAQQGNTAGRTLKYYLIWRSGNQ